jgi:peptidoglycan/LPS O-acetylase OafA/YrhL
MNRQFAALRGLAILLVVLHHSIDMSTLGPQSLGYPPVEGWEHHILLVLHQLGVFAVPTFLFISGSFVSYAARGKPARLSWKTIWAGLKRILVPYLIWSILFYTVLYIRRNETYTLLGYVKNLLVGYPFHFVPLLVLFYTLSPLLVRVARRFGALLVGIILLYQLTLIWLLRPNVFSFTPPGFLQFIVPPVVATTLAQWGIYFPLGLVYGLNAGEVRPWLHRLRWVLLTGTIAFFVLSVFHELSTAAFPLARDVFPVFFVLLTPLIRRNAIPMVRELETVGKKSYGLYLSHLVVLELAFWALHSLLPWVLDYQVLLLPLLFAAGVAVPLLLMNGVGRSPARTVQRYVFG